MLFNQRYKFNRIVFNLASILVIAALVSACAGAGSQETGTPGAEMPETGGETEIAVVPETGGETEIVEPSPAVTETHIAETQPAITGTLPAETQPAPGGEAQGSIRIAVVRGAMIETMTRLAQQYMDQNPGVKINIEEEPEGGAFEALVAAGNQPDLIVVSFGTQIGRLANQESVIPLEDMPGAQELFARLEPLTLQEVYGHHYYIPIGADVTMMIYNKQLFEEAGLDPEAPPKTWDDFLAAAEQIQGLPARENGDKVYGTLFWNEALTWGGWYWNTLQPIYLNANQNSCQLLNRLGTDVVFDQPECKLAEFFDFVSKAQKFAPPPMEKNFFSFGSCRSQQFFPVFSTFEIDFKFK